MRTKYSIFQFDVPLIVGSVVVAITLATLGLSSSRAQQTEGAAQQPVLLPPDYREWRLISVAHEDGDLRDLRAILGNDLAIKAYRTGSGTFPDGAKIVRLAWTHTASQENNQAFGREQSFVPGEPTNIQLIVKDSAKFIDTGGWGYSQFSPAGDITAIKTATCFACHTAAKKRDYVFTLYAR